MRPPVMPTWVKPAPSAPPEGGPVALKIEVRKLTAPPGGEAWRPPPNPWTSDEVKAALTTLNAAEGSASVDEKFSAYELMRNLVGDSYNFSSEDGQKDGAAIAAAFVNSAYTQRLNGLYASITGIAQETQDGLTTPDSIQRTIDAFKALSADDQQTYIKASNLQRGGQVFASPESYVAHQTAWLGVQRELRNVYNDPDFAVPPQPELGAQVDAASWKREQLIDRAIRNEDQKLLDLMNLGRFTSPGDMWTTQMEAYFADYGPPPSTSGPDGPLSPSWRVASPGYSPPSGEAIGKALVAINDKSGKTSSTAQRAAYDMLYGFTMRSGDYGPTRDAIQRNLYGSVAASAITREVQAATYGSPVAVTPQALAPPAPAARAAVAPGVKANTDAQDAAKALVGELLEKYGAKQLSDIVDPDLTGTDRFKALLSLFGVEDRANDPWTAKAQAALALWSNTNKTV